VVLEDEVHPTGHKAHTLQLEEGCYEWSYGDVLANGTRDLPLPLPPPM
jgi:hypothetical protein